MKRDCNENVTSPSSSSSSSSLNLKKNNKYYYKKKGSKKETGNPLPPDWTPEPELLAWAFDEFGLDRNETMRHVAAMHDWARAKDKRAHDWNAFFRAWIRNSPNFKRPTKSKHNGPQSRFHGNLFGFEPLLKQAPNMTDKQIRNRIEHLKKIYDNERGRPADWVLTELDQLRTEGQKRGFEEFKNYRHWENQTKDKNS